MSASDCHPPLPDALRAALVQGLARQWHGKTAVITADPDAWRSDFEAQIKRVKVMAPADFDPAPGSFRTVVLLDVPDRDTLEALLPPAWEAINEGGRLVVIAANAAATPDRGFERRALRKLLKPLGKVRLLKDQPFRWLAMNVIKCDEGERELSDDKRRRYEVTARLCRGKVLELGCGRGHLADHATRLGCTVLGVDMSDFKINDAKQRYPDPEFLEADILEVDLPEASYDTVLLPEILEHVDEDTGNRMLDRAWRWVAPGGQLIISVPNEDCIPHPHHIRWFNTESVSEMLRKYGSPHIIGDQPYKWILASVERTES